MTVVMLFFPFPVSCLIGVRQIAIEVILRAEQTNTSALSICPVSVLVYFFLFLLVRGISIVIVPCTSL
jgi:hypothetical protein